MALNLDGLDGVSVSISSAILAAATSVTVDAAVAPYIAPPDPGADYYYLTLIDYANRAEAWERVKVTAKVGQVLTIERNIASSTGSAIDFAAGALIQWTPGVLDLQESGGGGGGQIVLSSGGNSDAYFIDENWAGAPLYFSPAGTPYDSVGGINLNRNGEVGTRWYNTTGADLTVTDFFIYTHNHQVDDELVFEIFLNAAGTGMLLTFPSGSGSSSQRTAVNPVVIPDGEYISVFADTDLFQIGGDQFYITNMQLVLS